MSKHGGFFDQSVVTISVLSCSSAVDLYIYQKRAQNLQYTTRSILIVTDTEFVAVYDVLRIVFPANQSSLCSDGADFDIANL